MSLGRSTAWRDGRCLPSGETRPLRNGRKDLRLAAYARPALVGGRRTWQGATGDESLRANMTGETMSTATSQDRARDTILRDGSSIRVRPARPEDQPALLAFLAGLALESRRMRFGGIATDLDGLAHRWAAPADPADCSLVAETGIADRIIGHGSYDRVGSDSAEVAFIVADDCQGRGIAMLLVEELAERAQEAGISTFCADVLAENARMLRVFHESGFPTRLRVEPGAVLVEFPTALTGPARERFERREPGP